MDLAITGYVKALTPCYEKFKQQRDWNVQKEKPVDTAPQSNKAKALMNSISTFFSDAVQVFGNSHNNPCMPAKELNPFYNCFPNPEHGEGGTIRKIFIDFDDEGEDGFPYLPNLPSSPTLRIEPEDASASMSQDWTQPQEEDLLQPEDLDDQHVIYVRTESSESEAEDQFLSWDCDFFDYLDELRINRREFVNTLNEVVLQSHRNSRVDELVRKWCLECGLDEVLGEELLFYMVGKAYIYDLEACQNNFRKVSEDHVEIQEAIFSQINKVSLCDRQCYDQIESFIFAYCENNVAPRSINTLKFEIQFLLLKYNLEWETIEKLFGSLHSLVQVGPHKTILVAHRGEVNSNLEFGELTSLSKYPTDGVLLCKSHWGNVYRLGGFNQNLIVKVIALNKWDCKKSGFDSWNDDVALEIETHRILSSFNHPNIVRFEAVTQDIYNLYYYQEAGTELFGTVEKHRDRFWNKWKNNLTTSPRDSYLTNMSPWEKRALTVFRGIFEGVKLLHENGIVHRDIKLENMICVCDNGNLVGKLIDFGVCLRFGEWENNGFRSAGRVGTYPFMSPEMAFNGREHLAITNKMKIQDYDTYDAAKNDVWLLGQALWGYSTGVLLWSEISSNDSRFTVATQAQFHDSPLSWIKKRKGLRYLARRYGPSRNEMMTDKLIDLLEKIFTTEEKRLTIQECLEHPWFQQEGALDAKYSTKVTSVPLTPRTVPAKSF